MLFYFLLDNWNNVWYDTRRGSSEGFSAVFCIAVAATGMFIMLNIFLSILLVNFAEQEDEEVEIQTLEEIAKAKFGLLSAISTSPMVEQFRKFTFRRKSDLGMYPSKNMEEILDTLPTPVMSPIGSPAAPIDSPTGFIFFSL